MKTKRLALMLAALLLHSAVSAQQEAEPDENETESGADSTPDAVIDEIITTGTRLGRHDPSSRVETITADDIEIRGLATLEDVIRSIPQNYSTINGATNMATATDLSDVSLGTLGVGISTANLRGLGSAATLILVNGRRLSGSAGQQEFFANLRDIPAAAIERVEVLLDGGSQIYGSDAIGGVINVILRKNYTGAQLSARYENSSTGGDLQRVNGYFGYAWGSGSLSTTASLTQRDPILNADVGFVTRDHRSNFPTNDTDQNLALDQRLSTPRAGVVVFLGDPTPRPEFILPVGDDGRNIGGAGDLIAYDQDSDRLDQIDPHATEDTEDVSVTVNLEQALFNDRIMLRGELLQTRAESERQFNVTGVQPFFRVPESNAFNNFGEDVGVLYFPTREIADGLAPNQRQEAITKQRRYSFGLDVKFTDRLQWTTETLRSKSEGLNDQTAFRIEVNPALGEDPLLQARLDELLASDDPAVAVNFFGDGSGQNASISEFFVRAAGSTGETETEIFTTYLRGELFDLPAGPLEFVLGREVRDERIPDASIDFLFTQIGQDTAERQASAVFAELSVPVFGHDNAIPGLYHLSLSLQGRRDEYESSGAVGREDVPFPQVGDPIIVNVEYDHTSPRFGVAWQPSHDLLFRASHSEGFRAPTFGDLFSVFEVELTLPFPFIFDPLLGRFVTGTLVSGGNSNLQPETSEDLNVGFTYTPRWLSGFHMQVDYSRIEYTNRIASVFELNNILDPEVLGSQSDIYERDENGVLQRYITRPINISETFSEILDVDMSYEFDSAWGRFEPGLNLSYVLDQFNRAAEGGEAVEFRGRTVGLDRYRLTGRLGWERHNWSGAMFVHHVPSYVNDAFFVPEVAVQEIDSRTTIDFSVAYRLDNLGLTVRAGARNLLDEDFPFGFFGNGVPFDGKRVDLRGRVAYVEATVDFSSVFGK